MNIEEVVARISSIQELEEKEKYLKTVLNTSTLSKMNIETLRKTEVVERHLSLQGILEKYSDYRDMNESNQKEENRPVWQKILLALGVGP